MPIVKQVFDPSGRPILEVYVSVGSRDARSARDGGERLPPPRRVVALIDTGAGQSQVDLEVVESLGLQVVAERAISTASTGHERVGLSEYVVDLSLAGERTGLLATDFPVLGSPFLPGLRVGMLIGRDLIGRWLMTINGRDREFWLAYDPPADPLP